MGDRCRTPAGGYKEVSMARAYSLTEEQVRFYEQNGYIQLLGVLTPEELEHVQTALDEVMAMQLDQQHDLSRDRPDYERIFVQKVNLWQGHAGMRQYVFNSKLIEFWRLLAPASIIRLWLDHTHGKKPGNSSPSHSHPYTTHLLI